MLATPTLILALAVPSPVGPDDPLRPPHPDPEAGGRARPGRGDHEPRPDRRLPEGARRGGPGPDPRWSSTRASEEGRPLHVLAVGSPERLARLEETKKGLRALADPRGLAPAEADRLVRELPAVVWLIHGVHGNEISSPDAALALAHHLLAAQGDEEVDLVRREAIVLIDPLQNPDGRARFLATNGLGRAAAPDPEPAAAEHDEGWPGGRSNHYLFDMNRDWFAADPARDPRPARVASWSGTRTWRWTSTRWGATRPTSSPPRPRPLNPHLTRAQQDWHESFGRAIAASLRRGGARPTSSARSSTPSTPGTARPGRCSTARSG